MVHISAVLFVWTSLSLFVTFGPDPKPGPQKTICTSSKKIISKTILSCKIDCALSISEVFEVFKFKIEFVQMFFFSNFCHQVA